jgi:rhodanese-related sulfurtransferase
MWGIAIISLHAFVAQAHSKELALNHTAKMQELILNRTADMQDITDMLANKLVDNLLDKLVSLAPGPMPQASTLTIPGRSTPSSLFTSWAARTALAPHARYAVVPNAVMDKKSSKQALPFYISAVPPFVYPGVRPEEAKTPLKDWPTKYRNLLKQGLKPVTPQEAVKMMQTPFFPAKLVDVRLESQFAAGHPQGALSVPLFRMVQGNSAFAWSKRVTSYSLGVQPTERNPDFQAEALKQLNRNQPIIIVCDRGGTVEKLADDAQAKNLKRYTASLKAADELYEAGFKKLFFLEGGIREWDRDGLPVEGNGVNPIASAFGLRL